MTGISIKNKMKIIWKILFLKRNSVTIEIEECIEPYKIVDGIKAGVSCDNSYGSRTGCTNEAKHCLSRTWLVINVSTDDHVHVCESCTEELLGKILDFR